MFKSIVSRWIVVFALGVGFVSIGASFVFAAEDFKGSNPAHEFTLGLTGGLGVVDSTAGFALIGSAAKKIIQHGFVPDINNQVFIELELGPMFASGTTAMVYSAHLRWDFPKDEKWTFFALGGFGGNITDSKLGDHWELFPRFGVGAFWSLKTGLALRGVISHELMVVGVMLEL
jgi:hypothetical protein